MSETNDKSGAEALDDVQLGADGAARGDEPSIECRPDRPLGVDEPQVVDDAVEDPLVERLAREEPDLALLPEVGQVPVLAEDDDGVAFAADAIDFSSDEPSAKEAALHGESEP